MQNKLFDIITLDETRLDSSVLNGEIEIPVYEQLGNLPPLCKNIAGGWTQNAISIIFAKYRLVSEVLGIWFLRRAISNFVHNFLLISVKD